MKKSEIINHRINENQVGDFSTWCYHDLFDWFLRSTGPQHLFKNFAGPEPKKS